MKIACIGWGSLIWNPRELKAYDQWSDDGPFLPVEFTRISADDRVTLIIDKPSEPIQTLWSLMTTDSLEIGIRSLQERERTKDIHHITSEQEPNNDIREIIKTWVLEKQLDAAIWTGLSYSEKTDNARPTIDYIIEHLVKMDPTTQVIAEEYIRRAPLQTDTEYRRIIEKEFGWTPI